MSERPRIFVMNDPHAMRINRDLADEIGFQESVIFLQLEYLITNTRDPSRVSHREGRWWFRATLQELHSEQFSWWSPATISRVLHRLVERSLIVVDSSNNKVGYDRTQWYAIDIEGVRELDSIAIFQNEKSILQNETPISHSERSILQNETTIQAELVVEEKESPSNEGLKKADSLSSDPSGQESNPTSVGRVRKLSDAEAGERFESICRKSSHGDSLRALAEIMAEENRTGEVKPTRVWREIASRYLANRKRHPEISEDAWAYGFEQAIAKGAANIGYVTRAAQGYRPHSPPSSGSTRHTRIPVASDYDPAGY